MEGASAYRGLWAAAILVLVPLGPWVDDGAAPCDPAGQYCFPVPDEIANAASCSVNVSTPDANIEASCEVNPPTSNMPAAVGASRLHPSAPSAAPGSEVSVKLRAIRTAAGPPFEISVVFDPEILGAEWKSGNSISFAFGRNETEPQLATLKLEVDDPPSSVQVVVPFVYHVGRAGGYGALGFFVGLPADGIPGAGLVLLVLAVVVVIAAMAVWSARRKSP